MVPQKGGEGYRKILHRPDLLRGKVGVLPESVPGGGHGDRQNDPPFGELAIRPAGRQGEGQDRSPPRRWPGRGGGLQAPRQVPELLLSLKEETLGAKIDSLRAACRGSAVAT